MTGEKPVQELEDAIISSVPIREMASAYAEYLLQQNEGMLQIDVTPQQYEWLISKFRVRQPLDKNVVRTPGRPRKIKTDE